jgi:hypothetical protein
MWMLNEGLYLSDTIIEVEKQEIKAHKIILAARCPEFFSTMFQSGMWETGNPFIVIACYYNTFIII